MNCKYLVQNFILRFHSLLYLVKRPQSSMAFWTMPTIVAAYVFFGLFIQAYATKTIQPITPVGQKMNASDCTQPEGGGLFFRALALIWLPNGWGPSLRCWPGPQWPCGPRDVVRFPGKPQKWQNRVPRDRKMPVNRANMVRNV